MKHGRKMPGRLHRGERSLFVRCPNLPRTTRSQTLRNRATPHTTSLTSLQDLTAELGLTRLLGPIWRMYRSRW